MNVVFPNYFQKKHEIDNKNTMEQPKIGYSNNA
ncbi:hypothetical protein P872_11280 [Rhodonellum psychrophilum GCM71 = DSM 17998]|uniref:Uncharacterized protein n=2 Tax=Rhodonellum TaxID=336827 RepID=U5BSC9_9BACT|nr:hypothetical protein P872_11280 [Rhodonellum psychrophilum GCM71 = DSM 17998]SDY45754.1 hypothetical protein SAMN05444412_101211 [Rhodonellum ikkaensis]